MSFSLISSILKTLDRFSIPLSLKCDGKAVFKTKLGGFISLTIFVTIFAFSFVRFQKMIGLEDPILYEVT